jgi:hypothetical protein
MKGTLRDCSLTDLENRKGLLDRIIRDAQREGVDWSEAARQQRIINEAIAEKTREERRARGEADPPPVMVGVRAARAGVRARR